MSASPLGDSLWFITFTLQEFQNLTKRLSFVISLVLFAVTMAAACNIPVFRFALERWKPDECEAIVLYRGSLSPAQEAVVQQLETAATQQGGTSNLRVERRDLDSQPAGDVAVKDVAVNINSSLPNVVVRSRTSRGTTVTHWSRPLDEATVSKLLRSPARQELAKRLLRGDSVVWLLLKSADDSKNAQATTMLRSSFKDLETQMQLPDGIGLPGSELFSDVPLLIQFSLLEIEPNDPEEPFLLSMISSLKPDAVAGVEPILVPVFGRGRALEVIPLRDASATLVKDLTQFLGAACSCQVKQQNPGFDLLLSVDWNKELYGEEGLVPPDSIGNGNPESRPVLLTIPRGRK